MKHFRIVWSCLLLAGLFLGNTTLWAQSLDQAVVVASDNHVLPSLRDAAVAARAVGPQLSSFPVVIPNRMPKEDTRTQEGGFEGPDPLLQNINVLNAATTSVLASFDGADNNDNATTVGFRVAPPDTDGDVGPSHYVQMINLVTTIFDRNGNIVPGGGPFPTNVFWTGMSGNCEPNNQGDPIVLYDETNDRWFVSQFAFDDNLTTLTLAQCVAVSQTGDPTGAYNRYEFSFSSLGLPDYPKHGITTESVTLMANLFTPPFFGFAGTFIGAIDKNAMYAGTSAQLVGFNLGASEFGFVAADLDDPSGTAGFVPALFATAMSRTNRFDIWQVDPDFPSGSGATATRIAGIPIASFDTDFCTASREACIPQPSPGSNLETLSDRLMHRLQIRDFGGYQTMVASHTVDVGGGRGGIRWYELRNSGSGWSLYQEGTYGPNDGINRWMPSIAMNAAGDIGMGYLMSSTSTFLSIGVNGQSASNSGSGLLDGTEETCVAGTGAQTSTARAGDYSATSVDPVTDSFWHTNEYGRVTGQFEWATRVCAFEVVGGPVNDPPVVTITAPADGASFNLGDAVTFTGTAVDTEDGTISGGIAWSSSLDGALGTGAGVTTSSLSAGTHTITASATDSGGRAGSDQITVTIVGPSATDVHVVALTTGTQGGRRLRGTATVTVQDDLDNPAVGYSVTVQFSGSFDEVQTGTTDANGVVTLVTSERVRTLVSIGACVESVTGSLPYDPSDNAESSFACSGGGPTPIDVHVQNIETGQQGAGGGNKRGTATVTIFDDTGGPAAGYTVTGNFSGDITETGRSAVTNGSGVAVIATAGTVKGKVSVAFCVSGVGGALPYDAADNASSAYACSASKGALAGRVPDEFALEQNFPNPFNPSTVIAYSLAEAGPVTLTVYNMLGQEVASLVDGFNVAGRHEVAFDASRLSAGVYLYVIRAGRFTATARMTLLK